ncbi:hypothetical protein CsSME_00000293 [Camellia sinensis var. sinensis]
MKGMKGKLLKKLKSIKPIGYLKTDRVLHLNASDGFVDYLPIKSNPKVHTQMVCEEEDKENINQSTVTVQEPEIIDVSELMRDLTDDEVDLENDIDNKENIRPKTESENPVAPIEISSSLKPQNRNSEPHELPESRNCNSIQTPLSEIDVNNFRRPELNSGSLFDPNLLAAFEQVVMIIKAEEAERRARIEEMNRENTQEEPPLKAQKIEENRDPLFEIEENRNPLSDFEEKCPPGGSESVIFYTTGLRGIRKTFEDCNSIRFLLESFRVLFFERDVSMHSEFREELWRIMGEKVVPPRLFIKGRYIGGAEKVLTMHEQGKLRPLFEGLPMDRSAGPCEGCVGFRFVVCFRCNGSHKVFSGDDDGGSPENCLECNENGLIICPICC